MDTESWARGLTEDATREVALLRLRDEQVLGARGCGADDVRRRQPGAYTRSLCGST